jgi:hypothetical protein
MKKYKKQEIGENVSKTVLGYISDVNGCDKLTKQRDRAMEYQDYFRGNQWSQKDYEYYTSQGVSPVTLNRCRPVVKSIIGMYLRNKNSIRVMPVKNGTKAVAQVLTELVKHTEDKSNADYVYCSAFMNGIIDTESYLYLDVDKSDGDNGQILVKGKNLFEVTVDPSCDKYDINDPQEGAKFAIVTEWIDKKRMILLHQEFNESYGFSDKSNDEALRAYMCNDDEFNNRKVDENDLLEEYRFCVKTVWWREPVQGILVKDKQTRMSRIISEDNENYGKFKKAKGLERFEVSDYYAYRLHKTTVVNSNILGDEVNPYGDEITDLPIFRYSPYWNEGYASGQLDDLVSLNKEENIHRTQTIKIINSTTNAGWKIKKAINEQKARELANYGSVNGVVIETDDYGGFAEKIQPNQLPTGIFAMGQQFQQDVKYISGIDDATMGMDNGSGDSGRAISLRQQQNQVATEITFNNFYHTLELAGQYMVEMIRLMDVYTDDEILNIITESPLMDKDLIMRTQAKLEAEIGGGLPKPQPLPAITPEMFAAVKPEDKMTVINTIQEGSKAAQKYAEAYPMMKKNYDNMMKYATAKELIQQLRNDKLGQYGIKVTISPSAPTEQMLRFMEIDSVASKYPGIIPPDIMIDATNLSNKDEIKDRIQQGMQQQAAAQQMQQMQQQGRPAVVA